MDQNDTDHTTSSSDQAYYLSDGDEILLEGKPKYRTYYFRWYVLISFMIFSYSNGLAWLIFAPIPKFTAAFYGVTVDIANYLTTVFFIGSVIASLPGMFVLDSLSLREALWIGNFLNLLGTSIRVISCFLPGDIQYLAFSIAMLGQAITSTAQPFCLFSPPKLASVWFAGDERVVANTLCTVINVVGIGSAMILAPVIVTAPNKLPFLLCITSAPPIISSILSVGVWKRRPAIPPSSSSCNEMNVWHGIKRLVRNYQFIFLLIVWSFLCGLFNVVLTLLPQFLCPFGYTNLYGGVVGAIMVFTGLGGALIFGFIVDKTKLFAEVAKGALCLSALALILLMEVFRLPNNQLLIGGTCMMVGFFALIELPIFTELAIEVSYPVPEGTCTGILWTGAQLTGAFFTIIAPMMATPPNPQYQSIDQCNIVISNSNITSLSTSSSLDFLNFFYLMTSIIFVTLVVFVFFFRPKYLRIESEKLIKQQAAKEFFDKLSN